MIAVVARGGDSLSSLGDFIRTQRELMSLSLRKLAEMSRVSNPYLSQIERGLYTPSAQVLKGIADALDISAETLYRQAGLLGDDLRRPEPSVEDVIRLDTRLTTEQKEAMIRVYRGFVGDAAPSASARAARSRARAPRAAEPARGATAPVVRRAGRRAGEAATRSKGGRTRSTT
jgi:transcriptional regulator with XRE-family HTH domain